jgi:hypothetical protein
MAEVFSDDFSADRLSLARWLAPPAGVALDGGRLRFATGGAARVDAAYGADLRGSSFTIAIDAPDYAPGGAVVSGLAEVQLSHGFNAFTDGTNLSASIDLQILPGMLRVVVERGANPDAPNNSLGGEVVPFEGAYDPVRQHVLRVREDAGVLYFEAAPALTGPFEHLGTYGAVAGEDTRFTAAVTPTLIVSSDPSPTTVYFDDINPGGGGGSFCPADAIDAPERGFRVGGPFLPSLDDAHVVEGPPLGSAPISGLPGSVRATSRTRYALTGRAYTVPFDASLLSIEYEYLIGIGTRDNGATLSYLHTVTGDSLDASVFTNPDPSNPSSATSNNFCHMPVPGPPRQLRIAENHGDLVLSYSLDGNSFTTCGRKSIAELGPLLQPDGVLLQVGYEFSAGPAAPGEVGWAF